LKPDEGPGKTGSMKKTKHARIKLSKESVRLLQASVAPAVAGGKISNGLWDCCDTDSMIVDTTVSFKFGHCTNTN
jgi:hypothetical protein